MTTGPAQQSVPKIATSAPPTAPNDPPTTAALSLVFMIALEAQTSTRLRSAA